MEQEKKIEHVEYLDSISLRKTESGYEIVIKFDGGGAAIEISKKDNSKVVATKLRYFAELIERSVAGRAATQQLTDVQNNETNNIFI